MICPKCGTPAGKNGKTESGKQKYRCRKCKHNFERLIEGELIEISSPSGQSVGLTEAQLRAKYDIRFIVATRCKGLKPWEYPDNSLLTLCQPCHHKYHTEHELTIFRPKKKNKGPAPQRRKPQIKIEKKKKRPIIPLTTIQAQRPLRFRKKVNNEWVEVVRNVI